MWSSFASSLTHDHSAPATLLKMSIPVTSRRLLSGLEHIKNLLVKSYEQNENVLEVVLNRPNKLNAFNTPFWKELLEVFECIDNDSKCRCVVLSANGKSYCAGLDLNEGAKELNDVSRNDRLDVARRSRALGDLIQLFQRSFSSLEKCRKPVITVIHGHCIGAGISLASAADIRYATSDAIFSIKEVKIGIAADVGVLNRINRIVGNDSMTRELAFTARDFTASEALKYGFISRQFDTVDECRSAALSLACQIAERSPVAVQGSKLTLNYARDHTIDESLQFIRFWNQSQLQTEDIPIALTASAAKQKPNFEDV